MRGVAGGERPAGRPGAVANLAASAPEAYATLLDAPHARSMDGSLFGTANPLLVVARKTEGAARGGE